MNASINQARAGNRERQIQRSLRTSAQEILASSDVLTNDDAPLLLMA